jgi:uncharacterized protein DUF2130
MFPPEFRGTAGELTLLDDLRTAFPKDDLVPKKVGLEMPDIVQTVVTDYGERISTPIIWDMKTGESITPKDIEKIKRYKEKYDTDYCIVVTAKGITTKDSKSYRTCIFGKRDNVLLIHPKIAIPVAELTRNFVVEKTQLLKNTNGKASKESKLYEYITSSARFRNIREKIEKKLNLDELQRKEESYIKKTWNERKKLIQDWYDLDREDQNYLDSITQNGESNEDQDRQ